MSLSARRLHAASRGASYERRPITMLPSVFNPCQSVANPVNQ